jgi:hypothetical protein
MELGYFKVLFILLENFNEVLRLFGVRSAGGFDFKGLLNLGSANTNRVRGGIEAATGGALCRRGLKINTAGVTGCVTSN